MKFREDEIMIEAAGSRLYGVTDLYGHQTCYSFCHCCDVIV